MTWPFNVMCNSITRHPCCCPRSSFCVGEVIVIRPHLLGDSAQGYLLHNFREVEGQEEVLEVNDEGEEEGEDDEKVKEVREIAQLMHATW